MGVKHDASVDLIDAFCWAYLNEECFVLYRRLAGVLFLKRHSPVINGTAAAWAWGVAFWNRFQIVGNVWINPGQSARDADRRLDAWLPGRLKAPRTGSVVHLPHTTLQYLGVLLLNT